MVFCLTCSEGSCSQVWGRLSQYPQMKSTFIFDGGAHPPRVLVSAPSPDLETQALQIFTEDSEGNEGFLRPERRSFPSIETSFALFVSFCSILFGSQQSTIDYQLLPSTPVDCFQIADAAVGKNEQVPVPVNIRGLNKLGPAGKFIRTCGFVVECHRVVIDADVLRLRVTWISHAVLDRGANPRLLRWTKWRERGNPAPGIILETAVASVSH